MDGLAVGSICAVLLVLTGALTLLPAMLGFAGRSIDRLHIPGLLKRAPTGERGFWWRWSRTVQRRPSICGTAALAILVILAIPLFSMRLGFSDSSNDPTNLTTRQAYDALASGFGPGFNGPLLIVASVPAGSPSDRGVIESLAGRLQAEPGIAAVAPVAVQPGGRYGGDHRLPDDRAPSSPDRLAGAPPPQLGDPAGDRRRAGKGRGRRGDGRGALTRSSYLSSRLRWVIASGYRACRCSSLMAVFRSVAIPIKAAVMNLVSMGGAYGVIVAVFQWGWSELGVRGEPHRADRPVDPADDVHHSVRPVDGLRSVPALEDP